MSLFKLEILFIFFTTFLSLNSYSASKGIENLTQATTGIYRGARPLNESEIDSLSKLGIANIINLQGGDNSFLLKLYQPGEKSSEIEKEKNTVESKGMKFVNYPMSSLKKFDKNDDEMVDKILDYLSKKENRPLYIHCEHGKDRTGLIIALYKVKYEGLSPDKAYQEWLENGHGLGNRVLGNLDEYFFIKTKQFKEALSLLEKKNNQDKNVDCNQPENESARLPL